MRIAYLIPNCGVSGGIAVICQHANRLYERGHDVFLVSVSEGEGIDWFPNLRVPVSDLKNFPPSLDILVATAWSTAFRVAVLPAKHKFYFVQSDETRFFPESSAWEHLTRLSYSIGFNYLTEAKWICQWLYDGYGHKAELVPNGLDNNIFFPSAPLEAKGTKPRILLEGAIGLPYKGMAEAFEAVKDLDVEVWCVSSYGRPRKGWKCHKFFERVPIMEMRKIYASCDILLKLSRVEGFFGPPMEMMACGGAVVVGKVTGYDEYIENEYNALVVDPRRPLEAANAIKRIIDDSALKDRLICNGIATAKRWRWESSIDILENYYQEVVNLTRGASFPPEKSKYANSVSYFYEQMIGTDIRSSYVVSDGGTQVSETAPQAFIKSRIADLGATDLLLSFLRNNRLFRMFAVLVWRGYSVFKKISRR